MSAKELATVPPAASPEVHRIAISSENPAEEPTPPHSPVTALRKVAQVGAIGVTYSKRNFTEHCESDPQAASESDYSFGRRSDFSSVSPQASSTPRSVSWVSSLPSTPTSTPTSTAEEEAVLNQRSEVHAVTAPDTTVGKNVDKARNFSQHLQSKLQKLQESIEKVRI